MNTYFWGKVEMKRWKTAGFLAMLFVFVFLFGCEDPAYLKADSSFSRGNLQTAFVDTFSVVTSTVLLDSLPTSGNNLLLIGNYRDNLLGLTSSSTYFQIGYTSRFSPDETSTFDSIGLVLPYSKYWYGDTTKSVTINIHELNQQPTLRVPPRYRIEDRISLFTTLAGFYNTSTTGFSSALLTSSTVTFNPHRDSLYIRLPFNLGKKWFDLAKTDSASTFSNVNKFVTQLFQGIYLTTNKSDEASIAGFKATKTKVRLYYHKLFGENFAQTHFDFPLGNSQIQFNNIVTDRTGTSIEGILPHQAIPSASTGNVTFVQSGEGIVTKIEFPQLKSFLKNKKYILINAVLDVYPVQSTFSNMTKPPSSLALYLTDNSNVPIAALSSISPDPPVARIAYDTEYERETKYTFPLTGFISSQLTLENPTIAPLLIATPIPTFFTEVNRLAIGSQQNPTNKIKLKIYYSYASN